MTSIRMLGAGLTYAGGEPVLADLDLHLTPGWTGIVGANGAGKTTLVRLIAGELTATTGRVVRDPDDMTVAVCAQGVAELAPAVRALAARTDEPARRWRARLGCAPVTLERWPTLSPGERRRWQLAAALADEPDLLVLDEPTNHLDGEARGDLLAALARYRGVGLVVSHDRELLARLTTATVRVAGGHARRHPGSYDAARAQWEAARATAQAARAQARERVDRVARQLDRARRTEAGAARAVSAGARMKGPRDSDGRSMGETTRAGWAAAGAGRKVARLRRAADEAVAAAQAIVVDKIRGGDLFVDWEPPPRRWLAALDGVPLVAGAQLLAGEVRAAVARDARVRVTGANGAGKTTLLGALLAATTVPRERVLWLPQELAADDDAAIAAALRGLAPAERGRVGQIAAALGLDPAAALASGGRSPGETRKLAMALGLARRAWLVMLDEPTNHLDLPSIERLEAALAAYPGALVLVSHDDRFAARVTTATWRVGEGIVEC